MTIRCDCEAKPECTCVEGVVCVKNVSFSRGQRQVLDDITFCLDTGVFLGVIGPNGGGKTTLLKLILGLLPLDSGSIMLFGKPISAKAEDRSLIGYVPQRHEIDKNFPVSALDVVLMGAIKKTGLFRKIPHGLKDEAARLLERVGVGDLVNRPIGRMSGGQQQRTFIARALLSRPKLLILDEPTAGIDSSGQQQFLHLIRDLKEELNLTVMMVSHDVGQLSFYADQIACVNGRLHWHNRSALLDERVLQAVYSCEMNAYKERVREIATP